MHLGSTEGSHVGQEHNQVLLLHSHSVYSVEGGANWRRSHEQADDCDRPDENDEAPT